MMEPAVEDRVLGENVIREIVESSFKDCLSYPGLLRHQKMVVLRNYVLQKEKKIIDSSLPFTDVVKIPLNCYSGPNLKDKESPFSSEWCTVIERNLDSYGHINFKWEPHEHYLLIIQEFVELCNQPNATNNVAIDFLNDFMQKLKSGVQKISHENLNDGDESVSTGDMTTLYSSDSSVISVHSAPGINDNSNTSTLVRTRPRSSVHSKPNVVARSSYKPTESAHSKPRTSARSKPIASVQCKTGTSVQPQPVTIDLSQTSTSVHSRRGATTRSDSVTPGHSQLIKTVQAKPVRSVQTKAVKSVQPKPIKSVQAKPITTVQAKPIKSIKTNPGKPAHTRKQSEKSESTAEELESPVFVRYADLITLKKDLDAYINSSKQNNLGSDGDSIRSSSEEKNVAQGHCVAKGTSSKRKIIDSSVDSSSANGVPKRKKTITAETGDVPRYSIKCCKRIFSSYAGLFSHLRLVHTVGVKSNLKRKCKLCQTFINEDLLMLHIELVHTLSSPSVELYGVNVGFQEFSGATHKFVELFPITYADQRKP